MPLHNVSYEHWEGTHLGLWRRRLVIASNGLTACLHHKLLRHLTVVCWVTALAVSGLLFLVGQLLVADSAVVQWVGNLNPQLQMFAQMLTSWLEQHPQISVRTTQNVLFYYFCSQLLRLSIFALGMAIPLLVTRDLASNAMTIYASKAVSRGDYLIGKLATASGLVGLTWLGPVCAAWFVGNLLAPDWRFFWHARAALGHVLLYGLTSMTILSVLAVGVSAISPKEKSTVACWFIWWILGGVLAPIAMQTKPWLRHLSFNFDLDQVALAVFHVGDDLKAAQDNIPILGDMLRPVSAKAIAALSAPNVGGALLALLLMLGLAGWIIFTRVKPE
jgi:ABC-2 type transport system permease protein